MLPCLISELHGLKHTDTGNATMGEEDSQRHRFKIICDGFDRHTVPRESCNTSVSLLC